MADASFDRAAWLRRWKADAAVQKIERAAQRAEMARQGEQWLAAQGRLPKEVAATTAPAAPAPHPPGPPPIASAPPSAAELEFERVRRDAAARIAAERETHRADKAAVTMILEAYEAFEPADRATSRTPHRGSAAEEAAADLILSFVPNRRS